MIHSPPVPVLWTSLQSTLRMNPYAHAKLPTFSVRTETIEGPPTYVDSDGWTRISVVPATPHSAILLATDATYESNTEGGRRATLRDDTTDFQEKAVLHLKGRQWPVRRTAEGIVACSLEEAKPTEWTTLGWSALAELREVQIVIVNKESKEMKFIPEDVRCWKRDREILWIDHQCRYLWTIPKEKPLAQMLGDYEHKGWKLEWPLADGGMDELRAAAEACNESHMKVLKDALRKKVGRAQSIKVLIALEAE
jgi:hypothetical protein